MVRESVFFMDDRAARLWVVLCNWELVKRIDLFLTVVD